MTRHPAFLADRLTPECVTPDRLDFGALLRRRRIRRVAHDLDCDGLPSSIVFTLDDGTVARARAGIVPANGRPTTAALLTELAREPLEIETLEPQDLAPLIEGAYVASVRVSCEAGVTDPYAILLILDDGRQLAIEAQAIPAGSGRPYLVLSTTEREQ